MQGPTTIQFTPVMPWQHDAALLMSFGPVVVPFEYTGWRDETLSWKNGAYLGTSISMSPSYTIKGPDATKFVSEHLVNDFSNCPVGGTRHGIMCNDNGQIMIDGIIMRTAEDEYYSNWLEPYIGYALQKGNYDAVGKNITGQVFLFQVAGPRSLEILEKASGDDLHDIRFMRHRLSTIAGKQVRILRLGMAGTLAYEVHGSMPDAHEVYLAILEAGKDCGLKKLGMVAYMMNHTEDGFPQAYYHFPYPWYEDPEFAAYLNEIPGAGFMCDSPTLVGSVGDDLQSRFVTPVDVGWTDHVKFNHDFVGRAALEKMMADPTRRMVSLEWNTEDIMDIYGSQFRDGTPYAPIDVRPNDQYYINFATNRFHYHADWVFKDGEKVGISSGRSVSRFYQRMISLCMIDIEHSEIGTDVVVLWGDPGTRQKEIRAKVARFPYLDVERNSEIDVNKIPRPQP